MCVLHAILIALVVEFRRRFLFLLFSSTFEALLLFNIHDDGLGVKTALGSPDFDVLLFPRSLAFLAGQPLLVPARRSAPITMWSVLDPFAYLIVASVDKASIVQSLF